jgi:hypothetical protein
MNRSFVAGVLAFASVVLVSTTSSAQVSSKIAIRLLPLPERVASADIVLTGKVTEIEDKTISASPFPGNENKVEYHIAVIKLEDGILGGKGLTHVKVGFQIAPAPGTGRPIIGGRGSVQLTQDQEGIFFLQKHPTENFNIITDFQNFVSKKDNPNFAKDLELTKKYAKLLADPKANLKSKDAEDRSTTAALLIYRYTTYKPGATKREDIDAAESKQILEALADADFTKMDINPSGAFYRLNPQPKDGWEPVAFKDQKEMGEAAKKWLKDNADKFRVQRMVADDKK